MNISSYGNKSQKSLWNEIFEDDLLSQTQKKCSARNKKKQRKFQEVRGEAVDANIYT